jgi:hypothetical protein
MASVKLQIEELKKPNSRYVLEPQTIRGMIQEANNMDEGLKAVLSRMPLDGLPSTPRPPPQGVESASSPEGATSHREGLFEEEVRIAMGKLEI